MPKTNDVFQKVLRKGNEIIEEGNQDKKPNLKEKLGQNKGKKAGAVIAQVAATALEGAPSTRNDNAEADINDGRYFVDNSDNPIIISVWVYPPADAESRVFDTVYGLYLKPFGVSDSTQLNLPNNNEPIEDFRIKENNQLHNSSLAVRCAVSIAGSVNKNIKMKITLSGGPDGVKTIEKAEVIVANSQVVTQNIDFIY